MSLRSLLRELPCRPSEHSRFRSIVVDAMRQHAAGESSAPPAADLAKEALFLLRAQRHLKELNLKYFPTSGMSQKEVVEATAARVGLRMPKAAEEEGGSSSA